jgi:anti-sigma regulatory factor (Ser/Thr protein kinase)
MAGRGVRRDDVPHEADDDEPGDHPRGRSITLPGENHSVAGGRRFVRETLGLRHPAVEKVALGVSELATNAIKHTPSGAGGHITIGIVASGSTVRAEVTNDGTRTFDPRVARDADSENGRGILIVEALADAWGVIEHAGRTTVWAEFRAGPETRGLPNP